MLDIRKQVDVNLEEMTTNAWPETVLKFETFTQQIERK